MPTHLSLTNYSDIQLLELSRTNNEEARLAFEHLYTRHRKSLINSAYKRLQSLSKAEDIVQDVFLSLYKRRMELVIETSFMAYINTALKFSVLNEIRSMIVEDKYQQHHFFTQTNKTDFSDNYDINILNTRIEYTLSTLPKKCRQVFILSRFENLSYKLISNRLNISVSTVEKHIVKALKTMRQNLGQYRVYGGS